MRKTILIITTLVSINIQAQVRNAEIKNGDWKYFSSGNAFEGVTRSAKWEQKLDMIIW